MENNDTIMVNIFVSDFRILKEDPPEDAIEVQILSTEEEDGAKDLLRMSQREDGEWVPARVFAKFWSSPDEDESLPNKGSVSHEPDFPS